MGKKELLQLPRVNIFSTANNHVFVAPHNAYIALLIHLRQVTGMHPAVTVDGISSGLRVVPVTEHHAVATGTQLANLTPGNGVARSIDQLALKLWLGTPHRGNPQFQFIRRPRLYRYRAGFGHAIGDLYFAHMHFTDDAAHDLDRACGPGHNPRAQARQIKRGTLRVVEHGDKHGRHTVQPGGALLRNRLQRKARVKGLRRVDHGSAMGHATQITHHHAKAVIKRHGDYQTVAGRQPQAFAYHIAIIENVLMAEGRPLGEARSARGVLDIDRLVDVQAGFAAA